MASTRETIMSTAIPLFWISEIICGKQLGEGTYCQVVAVKYIILSEAKYDFPKHTTTKISNNDGGASCDDDREKIIQARQQLAHRFAVHRHRLNLRSDLEIWGKPTGRPLKIDDPDQEPAPKLALKRIKEMENIDELELSRDDLQRELRILKIVDHPNIIKLHGIGFDNSSNNKHDNTMPTSLILSQIRANLTQRIRRWRDDRGIGVFEALSLDLDNRRNQWVERLLVASKVAHALLHLHHHRILYRDLKPENIGFDAVDDSVQLYDFGLARLVPPSFPQDDSGDGNGLFQLTPGTGTLRYMAVEVGRSQPYGWTADVYSLGILLHEILSLIVPFVAVSPSQFRDIVWTQGERLPIDPSWPRSIQQLLPMMWAVSPLERLGMDQVVTMLDSILRGSDENLFPSNLLPPSGRGREGGIFSLFTR